MKRVFLLLAIAAFAFPATSLAKGPSEASLQGPGIGKTVTFTGSESEPGSSLMTLADAAGFFPAVFAQTPDPMLDSRPKGSLGPKYTIAYTVPGPDNDTFYIEQDAYPYANPRGLTYTKPGQKIFDMTTRGGWFESPILRETLNLPLAAPADRAASSAGFFSTERLGAALGVALMLAAGAWLLARRRPRAAAA
jgi:hypothetical protein